MYLAVEIVNRKWLLNTHRLSTACIEMYSAGTLNVSNIISAAFDLFFLGLRGASVSKTGCYWRKTCMGEGRAKEQKKKKRSDFKPTFTSCNLYLHPLKMNLVDLLSRWTTQGKKFNQYMIRVIQLANKGVGKLIFVATLTFQILSMSSQCVTIPCSMG